MFTTPRNDRTTLLLIALAIAVPTVGHADVGASGQFRIDETRYTVADAIAWRDDDELKIVFSDTAFDRAAFADDGELDSFDFMRHDGSTLELTIDPADGTLDSMSTQSGGGFGFRSGVGETLTLARRDANAVAGTFAIADEPGITFDLPITPREIERPGTALAADGGEPGQVFLARMAAVHAGDMATLMANTPPEQAVEMQAAIDNGEAEQLLAMAKMFTPTDIVITGGTQDGDKAWIDFTGKDSGSKVTGTGKLERIDGRWRVESVNTQNSD